MSALPAPAKRWHPTLSVTDDAAVFIGESEKQRGESAVSGRTRRTARSGGFGPLIFLSAREFALVKLCVFFRRLCRIQRLRITFWYQEEDPATEWLPRTRQELVWSARYQSAACVPRAAAALDSDRVVSDRIGAILRRWSFWRGTRATEAVWKRGLSVFPVFIASSRHSRARSLLVSLPPWTRNELYPPASRPSCVAGTSG